MRERVSDARWLFDNGLPIGTPVETTDGTVKYLLVRKDGYPFLSDKKGDMENWYNCYAYAFDDYALNLKDKPQPGYKSDHVIHKYSCANIVAAVLSDFPNYEFLGPRVDVAAVDDDRDLVYLVVDIPQNDYHFYKRRDGVWTHKPGLQAITANDASGRPVVDPPNADHNYVYYNYSTPCGFFARRVKP